MSPVFQYSWLMPIFPFVGASFLGLLLLFFSRTMNRLSKPVFAITFASSLLSGILSYTLFYHEFKYPDDTFIFDFASIFSSFSYNIRFAADFITSSLLAISSTIILVMMIILHKKNYRKQGYVRTFILIGFLSSAISCFLFSVPLSSMIS